MKTFDFPETKYTSVNNEFGKMKKKKKLIFFVTFFLLFWNVSIGIPTYRLRLLYLALIVKKYYFFLWFGKSLQDDDDAIDPPFTFLRFFFLAVKDSWPLSVFESLSESSSLELEDDELELLELSDAIPVLSSRFTWIAIFANSGSFI